MIEEILNKKLRSVILQALIVFIALLACGGTLLLHLKNLRSSVSRDQISLEAQEYKSRIFAQFQYDIQTLSAISALIEGPRDETDRSLLARKLDEANRDSAFVTVAFFDTDLQGVICPPNGEIVTDASLPELPQELQSAVYTALEGTPTVSRLFESRISQQRVFAYSIPVYHEGTVIGALSATDYIDVFGSILAEDTALGSSGYIHLLGTDGSFLMRSPNTVVQENLSNIYSGSYLSESAAEEVRGAMARQERIFSSFTHEGVSYPFLLEPVGLNGWYLFCVSTGSGLTAVSERFNSLVGFLFLLAFLLVMTVVVRGYRLLRDYHLELKRLAYYDPLTGAENMVRYHQRLTEAMGMTGGSVVALRTRQFPFVTEIFGKERANCLLCEIKEIIGRHLRSGEFFSRDTEDIFYLFLMDVDPDAVRLRLQTLIDELVRGTEISKSDYEMAFYCGVVPSPRSDDPGATADHMRTSVHFALEKAESGHTNTIWFFDTELHKKEDLENYIERHMNQALRDGEFEMFLQPKKDLRSDTLAGAEALVRWRTTGGRMIYPDQFIPLFERNGFCMQLDLYMVEQACRQIRVWLGRGVTPIPISVNQSKQLFFKPDYVQALKAMVRKYGISARLITLEILESLALENVDALNGIILQLHAEGFRISLDDFGSGFSSLNALSRLKIDELKLDRAFLLNLSPQEQARSQLIIKEIVQMARLLSIATVAEGVETAEDEGMIRALGCDFGQGYLYSRPVSAADFDRIFMQGQLQNGPSGKEV